MHTFFLFNLQIFVNFENIFYEEKMANLEPPECSKVQKLASIAGEKISQVLDHYSIETLESLPRSVKASFMITINLNLYI